MLKNPSKSKDLIERRIDEEKKVDNRRRAKLVREFQMPKVEHRVWKAPFLVRLPKTYTKKGWRRKRAKKIGEESCQSPNSMKKTSKMPKTKKTQDVPSFLPFVGGGQLIWILCILFLFFFEKKRGVKCSLTSHYIVEIQERFKLCTL